MTKMSAGRREPISPAAQSIGNAMGRGLCSLHSGHEKGFSEITGNEAQTRCIWHIRIVYQILHR